jgi:hypothetical protein
MRTRCRPFALVSSILLITAASLSGQGTPIPIASAPSLDAAALASTDAVSSATTQPEASKPFLGFKSKEAFHRFSGWTAGGTLLAAGIVGAVHAYDMMSAAHTYRDSLGIEEFDPALCPAEISAVYGDSTEQALRWTHVSLLAAGESFYLANAITGVGFIGPLPPGWSKAKLHRYAFFLHAGLMAAEGVMGYFSSEALQRGDHDTFHVLLVAHASVGIAIPVVILAAGAIMDRPPSSP